MTFENFSEVTNLSVSELRELLGTGEEVERLWAAWVLAMKLGTESLPELTSAATTSPSSGLRRHLIVILAGYGELEILKTFADCDPDPRVRATACLHLLQTRPIKDRTLDEFLLSVLLEDTDRTVRAVLLSNAVAHNFAVPIDYLIELASDPSMEVRAAALNVLKRRYSAKEVVEAGLIDKFKEETDQNLILLIAGICADADCGDRLLIAAKNRDSKTRGLLWTYFEGRKAKFEWQVLEGYTDFSMYPEPPDYLFELASDNALPQMFIWLTEQLALSIREDQCYADELLEMFETLLCKNLPISITPKCRAHLDEILDYALLETSSTAIKINEALSRLLSDN